MNRLKHKNVLAKMRKARVRRVIKLNSDLPRLVVNVSNKQIYAQIIDTKGKVIASANSLNDKSSDTMTNKAEKVGSDLAKSAIKSKVTKVAYDRGAKLYHGRIKALADALRNEGMEF